MASETIKNGILLSIKPYLENPDHSIIEVLTTSGKISMIAQGVNKPESKNKPNLQVGCLIEFTFFKARLNNKISKLKKANLKFQIDLFDYNTSLLVKKIMLYLKQINSHFNLIFKIYNNILPLISIENPAFLLTYFIANTLKCFGIQPSINGCVECQEKNEISDFSFKEGGFLCAKHEIFPKEINYLKSCFYLFLSIGDYIKNVEKNTNQRIYVELLTHLKNNGVFISWEEWE